MATSDLLVGGQLDRVLTLGDNQYEQGTLDDFMNSYDPSWGRVHDITSPAAGNHEYGTTNAAGYFEYFGAAAGDPAKGYYSYDIGTWHLIALNSNCAKLGPVDGCAEGMPQNDWLEQDLADHPNTCTLAYWHHPRFSTGEHGGVLAVAPFWDDLYDAGADVVLGGHSHNYERFTPMNPAGVADPTAGISEFVVGTGGKNHVLRTTTPPSTSMVRNFDTFGVLELTLRADTYDWEFVPEAGGTFTDSGSGACN
ncbi:MAG: metallophosphoesterase [Nocardioidaceae bacterium]|nr:metallophosphoesterase [Nocardioidaceae bacterium]